MKTTTNFPPGWDEERVQRLLRHYDSLSEDEAVAEDEAAFEGSKKTLRERSWICRPTVECDGP